MSKRHVYRFCVRNQMGEHSSVYRVFVTGNQAYLGHRGITGSYKASFHEDGACHVGLTSELRKTLVGQPKWDGQSRHYDRWNVRNQLNVGESVELFEILIPNSQLDKFYIKNESEMNWLECREGDCVSIVIMKVNLKYGNIIRSKDREFKVLDTMPMEDGSKVVIIYRLIDEDGKHKEFINSYAEHVINIFNDPDQYSNEKIYKAASFDKTSPEVRGLLGYIKTDGGRSWIEFSVRKNVLKA